MWQRGLLGSRERCSFALAILLHGALLFLFRELSNQAGQGISESARFADSDGDELAIDLVAPNLASPRNPTQATTPDPGLTPGDQARVSDRKKTSAAVGVHDESGAAAAIENANSDASQAQVDEPAPAEGTEASPPRAIDLGIGDSGWQRWVGARQLADNEPSQTPRPGRPLFHAPPASSTGGLQEGLEARDRALGLSPAGRVVSAFHAAAHDPRAPQLGNASFQVTVLESGEVQVSLGSSSSESGAWQAVAARAEKELRRKPPRIPKPRKGLRLTIELKVEQVFPNGTKVADLHGPRLETTPLRLSSVEEAQAELTERNPVVANGTVPAQGAAANVKLPGVFVAGRGKVCGYRLGLTPRGLQFEGGCDPSNAGAKPQRMVHARVREENLF